MIPRPQHKQEKVETVEYDIRLAYPDDSKLPKLFLEIKSGYRDGFNTRYDFPDGVDKAIVIYTETGFEGHSSYALARYVYS
jgi:hypothetical protein